jgi:hypothetical protein
LTDVLPEIGDARVGSGYANHVALLERSLSRQFDAHAKHGVGKHSSAGLGKEHGQ